MTKASVTGRRRKPPSPDSEKDLRIKGSSEFRWPFFGEGRKAGEYQRDGGVLRAPDPEKDGLKAEVLGRVKCQDQAGLESGAGEKWRIVREMELEWERGGGSD